MELQGYCADGPDPEGPRGSKTLAMWKRRLRPGEKHRPEESLVPIGGNAGSGPVRNCVWMP
jgi:hypothetical protein